MPGMADFFAAPDEGYNRADPYGAFAEAARMQTPGALDERGQQSMGQPAYSGVFGTKYTGTANDIGRLAAWGIDPTQAGWNQAGAAAAPTYDLNTEAGRAALDSQQRAANQGLRYQGMAAFMPDWTARRQQGSLEDASVDRLGQAFGISKDQFGSRDEYLDAIQNTASQYELIGGLSGGFGGSGDPREAFSSLYRNENGVLTPLGQTRMYSAPEEGGWLSEHGAARVAILGSLAVAAGPWIAALGAGAGAGAAGAAEGAAGAGAAGAGGITGTAGASGMAAYGGASTVGGGLGAGGATAGMGYGGLGAGMGSLGSGYGAAGASTLGSYGGLGASYWGAGGLGGYSGLGSMNTWGDWLSQKAQDQVVKKARNEVVKRVLGGGGEPSGGARGGLSGGGQGGSGGSGLAGLLGSPQLGAAQAQEKAWQAAQSSAQSAALRRRLVKKLDDE